MSESMSVNDRRPGLPDYVGPTKGWFTLLHHLGPVFEWSDNVMERVEYVKKNKPAHEIETRLRHMVYVGLTRPAVWVESERAKARAEYERVTKQAWAEYERVTKQAWAEYKRVEKQAGAEYERVARPVLAEYWRVTKQAWAEYERVTGPAWAEYERVKEQATKAVTAYLADLIPDCKWNGREIVFPVDAT